MSNPTQQELAGKLLADNFKREGPAATALSDPIADTQMVVTLDELRPYDHDPRVVRNPAYAEIKASIRERGLDAPPAITRRPGGAFYIIRNGGNTRLSILRELWTETRDERFFRVPCLFRPWPSRGEIVMLTGHLAENELRGNLTFIERALGVEKAREFYEQEIGGPLSQSELARRLAGDGFPVQRSLINRMQDAVRYLLPAIPTVLYGGLGRRQVERLAVLRRAAERTWDGRAKSRSPDLDFGALFQDVLSQFDATPEAFGTQRVQDELIGQMAELLRVDYDTLSLEIDDSERRELALTSESRPDERVVLPPSAASPGSSPRPPSPRHAEPVQPAAPVPRAEPATLTMADAELPTSDEQRDERLRGHVVSPVTATPRLQAIKQLVADHLGEEIPDFEENVLRAIPVQAGGLYPVSDVWYIEPGLDSPEALRAHIAQFAREIADDAAVAGHVEDCADGVGYRCATPESASPQVPPRAHAVLRLLQELCTGPGAAGRPDPGRPPNELASLLHGYKGVYPRLADASVVKFFRLVRLARRLWDLDTAGDIAESDGAL